MNAIIDFFTSFIDIIVSWINFAVSNIRGTLWFIGNIPQLLAGVTGAFGFVPDFLFPFMTFSVSLLVVYALFKIFF